MKRNEILIHASTWMKDYAEWKEPVTKDHIHMISFIVSPNREDLQRHSSLIAA
jgi:hypothetical protein